MAAYDVVTYWDTSRGRQYVRIELPDPVADEVGYRRATKLLQAALLAIRDQPGFTVQPDEVKLTQLLAHEDDTS